VIDTTNGLFVTAVVLVVLLALLVGVGWLTSRALGVHRGFGRALVAGVAGVALFCALLAWSRSNAALPFGAGTWILVGTVVMATMVVSVVLDALLKPRIPGRRRGLLAAARSARGRVQSWGRMLEIARHARTRRLNLTTLTTPQGARALRETLEDSGGILVKFGQIASARTDLLPAVLTEELAGLRSSVPGLPADVVRARIEAEFGAPVEQLFASFDPQPLAAASIGVTHRATLTDGRRVIVKVQRPGIEDLVDRDARVLLWAARRLEASRAALARLRITDLAQELIDSVRLELDFTREQTSNTAMRATRAGDPGMRFPEVLPAMTTRRVLVMEEVDGPPVSEADALDAARRSRAEMADNLLRSFLAQTLVDGLFHADPHPGNVLVDSAGDLWLIDYGAVGIIDPITLEGLQLLAGGFLQRDASTMARAVRRMVGTRGTLLDIAAVETDMAAILGRFAGGAGLDPGVLAAVADCLARYDVPAPPALTVLARAALTLVGTLGIIDPNFAMAQRSRPLIKTLAAEQAHDPQALLTNELLHALPSLRSIPQLAEDLALQARAGRLTIRSERFATGDREVVDGWIDRVLFVVIGVVGVLASVLLLGAAVLAEGSKVSQYLYGLGFAGLFLATAMLLRTLAQIQHRRRPQ
jgi:ubiquinone biosynthesis protein